MAAGVDVAEDRVGNGSAGFRAALVSHEQRSCALTRPEADRPACNDDDDHWLAGRLDGADQRLLIRRQLRLGVVTQSLGICLLADDHDDRVGPGSVRNGSRLVRRVDDVWILRLESFEHCGPRRDLVGWPHAADMARAEATLPADA